MYLRASNINCFNVFFFFCVAAVSRLHSINSYLIPLLLKHSSLFLLSLPFYFFLFFFFRSLVAHDYKQMLIVSWSINMGLWNYSFLQVHEPLATQTFAQTDSCAHEVLKLSIRKKTTLSKPVWPLWACTHLLYLHMSACKHVYKMHAAILRIRPWSQQTTATQSSLREG